MKRLTVTRIRTSNLILARSNSTHVATVKSVLEVFPVRVLRMIEERVEGWDWVPGHTQIEMKSEILYCTVCTPQ